MAKPLRGIAPWLKSMRSQTWDLLMVQVSLQQFVERGAFGPVIKGMSQAEVQRLLGKPEKRIGQKTWQYGSVECRFAADKTVEGIYVSLPEPKGWGELQIDSWIFQSGLQLPAFLEHLATRGIAAVAMRCSPKVHGASSRLTVDSLSGMTVVVVSSGVYVGYIHRSSTDDAPELGWATTWKFPLLARVLQCAKPVA